MELRELAALLGIEKYPDDAEEIYKNLPEDDGSLYDAEKIKAFDEEYGMLGKYLENALSAAEDIKNKDNLLTWLRLAYEYRKGKAVSAARAFPIPTPDETPARNMFAALLFMREFHETVEIYKSRGFSHEEIKENLGNLKLNLSIAENYYGTISIGQGIYAWLTQYSKALMFNHKGYVYQAYTWQNSAILLKNKKSGEYIFVMLTGKFHRDGYVLGSVGATDDEGAFDAEFAEFPDAFFGHRVKDNRVSKKREAFLKSEWKAVLRPGDDVIALHIPRKTNMTEDYVTESLKEGFAILRKRYPELSPKCISCNSWLLSPTLEDILGPHKNLTKFMNRFTKHPICDKSGTGCRGFVWGGNSCEIKDLPEDTSLQKGIKNLWLNGGFMHSYYGVITDSFDY